jgi:hypothetical protein
MLVLRNLITPHSDLARTVLTKTVLVYTRLGANEFLYPTQNLEFVLSLPLNANGIWSPSSLAFFSTRVHSMALNRLEFFFVILVFPGTC